jgi:hypothetical protein
VAYGAGLFVAVGTGGNLRADGNAEPWIEVSTDGIDWTPEDIQYTPAQLNEASQLRSITYGKSGFVTTDGVHVLHSSDGRNWNIEAFQGTSKGEIAYVIYDGTRYILYSNTDNPFAFFVHDSPWKVSTDGVNWIDYGTITVTNGPAGEPVSIVHVGGIYEAAWQPGSKARMAGGTQYMTATSTDGLSWTLGTPVSGADPLGTPIMYSILHTGAQYLVFGGTDAGDGISSWGVAFYGSSLSAMTAVGPLTDPHQQAFFPAGDPTNLSPYDTHGLVSNGTVTVALGDPGLLVTTDGVAWNHESLEGVVPKTGCSEAYPGTPTCTAFASGAAAPGGSIVVLVSGGGAGAETTDGIHWAPSNL